MARLVPHLHHTEGDQKITEEENWDFCCLLYKALLLALQEQGILDITQYHRAEEALNQRRIRRARELLEEGGQL